MTPLRVMYNNNLLIAIDMQKDFMEGGALGVPGSLGDIKRLNEWIKDNHEKLNSIIASLDTHILEQIFHSMWWVDRDGNNPEPFTLITLADVDSGKWLPVYEPEKSRECIANIEKYAKKTLCIWPYHCIKDTSGNDLEDQFASTLDSLRNVNKTIVVKGLTPYTEMYGIFKPEYDPDNEINIELLNSLRSYDKIFIAGEAADYCVYESVKQILEYYANEPEVTSKIYILEDCMSSISGKSVNEIFDELKNEYNLNIVKSTEYKL